MCLALFVAPHLANCFRERSILQQISFFCRRNLPHPITPRCSMPPCLPEATLLSERQPKCNQVLFSTSSMEIITTSKLARKSSFASSSDLLFRTFPVLAQLPGPRFEDDLDVIIEAGSSLLPHLRLPRTSGLSIHGTLRVAALSLLNASGSVNRFFLNSATFTICCAPDD